MSQRVGEMSGISRYLGRGCCGGYLNYLYIMYVIVVVVTGDAGLILYAMLLLMWG